MRTIKRHINRQESATWVVAFALAVVVLYSFWGASILNAQKEAATQGSASAVAVL